MSAAPERDRDAGGRARNSRPRDALGRPLPRGSQAGVERVPDELAMPLDEAIEFAQQYLDTDRPFHAHEVLEALWKSRPPVERDLWQGLAQICVGVTHALRGNAKGAQALLQRGSERVASYAGDTHGIDVDAVLTTSARLRDAMHAAHGVRPDAFRLKLR